MDWRAWVNAKYSPVQLLSDGEYEEMMREKLLAVDTDLALLDERIEAVKVEDREKREGRGDA